MHYEVYLAIYIQLMSRGHFKYSPELLRVQNIKKTVFTPTQEIPYGFHFVFHKRIESLVYTIGFHLKIIIVSEDN